MPMIAPSHQPIVAHIIHHQRRTTPTVSVEHTAQPNHHPTIYPDRPTRATLPAFVDQLDTITTRETRIIGYGDTREAGYAVMVADPKRVTIYQYDKRGQLTEVRLSAPHLSPLATALTNALPTPDEPSVLTGVLVNTYA